MMTFLTRLYKHYEPFLIPNRAQLIFSLLVWIASCVALLIAYALHWTSPYWAAITVWVVAQPSRGMTFSKGYYRLLGTCAGAAVALLLILFCTESPWIFLTVLSLWLGLCSATASLVRYFQSYGAILAGVTAPIVSLLAFSHPEDTMHWALARIGCVLLGIIVAAVFSTLVPGNRGRDKLFTKIRLSMADAFSWLSIAWNENNETETRKLEHDLISQMIKFEEDITYASAESMQVRTRSNQIRRWIASVLSVMAALRALQSFLSKRPEIAALIQARSGPAAQSSLEVVRELLARELLQPEILKKLSEQITELGSAAIDVHSQQGALLVERLADVRAAVEHMTSLFRSLRNERNPKVKVAAIEQYYDWQKAFRSALRSFVGVFLAGAAWLITDWHVGPLLVMLVAVNCALAAANDDPVSYIGSIAKASFFSFLAAVLSGAFLVTVKAPDWLVFLVLGVFLMPGGFLIAGSYYLAGAIYTSNFLLFISPSSPFVFSWTKFSDLAIGFVAGILFSWGASLLVRAPSVSKRLNQLRLRIRRDLERITNPESRFVFADWESLMYTRISQLIATSSTLKGSKINWVEGGLISLQIGRDALRMRDALAQHQFSGEGEKLAIYSLRIFQNLWADVPHAVSELKRCALALQSISAEQATASDHRAGAVMNEIADGLAAHELFFTDRERAKNSSWAL